MLFGQLKVPTCSVTNAWWLKNTIQFVTPRYPFKDLQQKLPMSTSEYLGIFKRQQKAELGHASQLSLNEPALRITQQYVISKAFANSLSSSSVEGW